MTHTKEPDGFNINLATGEVTPQWNSAKPLTLLPEWCTGGHANDFHSYPGDGQCVCGVVKHHVHGVCGHVTQVG